MSVYWPKYRPCRVSSVRAAPRSRTTATALSSTSASAGAALGSPTTLLQWLACYLVLAAYAWALCGLTRVFRSAALVTFLSIAWLTWPVWISPYLQGTRSNPVVDRIIAIHPLFAVNGVLANLGEWSHFPIAYSQLTRLGQDISYTFPASIWPSTLVHLIPGMVLWWAATWGRAKAPPSGTAPSSAAAQS